MERRSDLQINPDKMGMFGMGSMAAMNLVLGINAYTNGSSHFKYFARDATKAALFLGCISTAIGYTRTLPIVNVDHYLNKGETKKDEAAGTKKKWLQFLEGEENRMFSGRDWAKLGAMSVGMVGVFRGLDGIAAYRKGRKHFAYFLFESFSYGTFFLSMGTYYASDRLYVSKSELSEAKKDTTMTREDVDRRISGSFMMIGMSCLARWFVEDVKFSHPASAPNCKLLFFKSPLNMPLWMGFLSVLLLNHHLPDTAEGKKVEEEAITVT